MRIRILQAFALLALIAASASAQSRYEIRAGSSVAISTELGSPDFLLKASDRRVVVQNGPVTGTASGLTLGSSDVGDQLVLAASLRTKPGEYHAMVVSTSADGIQRTTPMDVVVHALPTVPTGASRPPVVLLNGWQTLYTNSCPISSNSSATFGNLAQYLQADGVPAVYFFDNCAEDANASIEKLGSDFGAFLNSITHDDGSPVTQFDIVAHSIGGLIARAYLAGLQPDSTLNPPANPLIRNMVLIATPNFGSFLTGNYANAIVSGSQSAEIIPASMFLWNLATWNQRVDDLRGVNAIEIAGNAGLYVNNLTGISLPNASDGIVGLTSASLSFVAQQSAATRIVPYCHVDPSAFTNQNLPYNCTSPGIANITTQSHPTSQIVRSFLAGTDTWQSIGSTPANDPYLTTNGGTFFALVNQTGSYVSDVTQVQWGTLPLQIGGSVNTIFFNDFVYGTGMFQPTSSSLGTIICGTVTEAVGYFAAARCKISTAIVSMGPLTSGAARQIASGAALNITGAMLGYACDGCKVTATPAGSSSAQNLTVSAWNSTNITAQLPATLSGFVTISVLGVYGNDSINAMVVAPAPSAGTIALSPVSLQFAASLGGGAPPAQSIHIDNGGAGSLTWVATTSAPWLTISPASGTAPSDLNISVSTSGLSAGTYTTTVDIASAGATNTPASIPVTLTISSAPPALVVNPTSLSFQYSAEGSVPAPQTVAIANGSGGALGWNATASDYWITLSGTLGTAPASLSISVDPSNLAAGTYNGSVQISSANAAGSPATITVSLTVQGSQPAGVISGVSNAGSFQPGIAPATWISIFGTNLSGSTYGWQATDIVNGQLPASLHGVAVTINGSPAYVDYISPKQINALVPDGVVAGPVQVSVITAQQQSNAIVAQAAAYAPSFFTTGGPYAAAVHPDYSLVDTTHPALPGEILQIYGTGFGPTNPPVPTSQLVTSPAELANPVQVTIGGVNASVVWAGLVEAGLYQLNVTVPASLPSGDSPVVATVQGTETQSGVLITVQQSPGGAPGGRRPIPH